MKLLAEWNRTDLTQFESGGSPDLNESDTANVGDPGLSVVALAGFGNVLRYTADLGEGAGDSVLQTFMLKASDGFAHPMTSDRRDLLVEMEMYKCVGGAAGGYVGIFFGGDVSCDHGFAALPIGNVGAGWQFLRNGGVTIGTNDTPAGGSVSRTLFEIRGNKPSGAAPGFSLYVHANEWNNANFVNSQGWRTGANAALRGGSMDTIPDFGSDTTLASSWNNLDCDRIGIAVKSTVGNPPPTTFDLLNLRVYDPSFAG